LARFQGNAAADWDRQLILGPFRFNDPRRLEVAKSDVTPFRNLQMFAPDLPRSSKAT
jgi:hypothetical protein